MNKQIDPQDRNIKSLFQDFYRVPDYQREYVWGETDPRGEGGEEVEQFLSDIYSEYQNASKNDAPEYFIGTVVVCREAGDVFDLIDGQQRTTTAYLTLCALRDKLVTLKAEVPEELPGQIIYSSTNWQGETTQSLRLDLQYEDAGDVLRRYAEGAGTDAPSDGTRSIRNLYNAYLTIKEFIETTLKNDPAEVRRFYGYFTNKVKIIRIETPTVAVALKIFETINDRGVGLDAMDLLKNLLFMNARGEEFSKLKAVWKQLTDAIYQANEKPLRFLRYYLLAAHDVDGRLREDAIYDWFRKNAEQTNHEKKPLVFAGKLLDAAKAYAHFAKGRNVVGEEEAGIINTRLLGGKSIKQHFILLLAGRSLSPANFSKLADELEKTMFVWLLTGTSGKEYERRIIEAAHQLNKIADAQLELFLEKTLRAERQTLAVEFRRTLLGLKTWQLRGFRLRYLLAKLTQYIDLQAYGPSASRDRLSDYTAGGNDIEHILASNASAEAAEEFGEGAADFHIRQCLGNLLLIEKAINRALQNGRYSGKIVAYEQSKFLLTKCQADAASHEVGKDDRITATVRKLESWQSWNAIAVTERQEFLSKLADVVWDIPMPSASSN
ncbi:DUF262 domain-containing protein [Rhizobium leguminosarum]|uniref:DUF262 domain-containing protein n=1 Tax=Rhizobium leguminosarum TaxID=384 RepID=UPI001031CC4C|nr:DUF262 domain-containing protein [Rhizobium leguminosarum]TBH22188.1 DUF262 domain-containing protein [Rhizobium leguminosarum]